MIEKSYTETARLFCDAIKELARKPANMENLERYLSNHFSEWLEKYANTPDTLTAELCGFALMDID